MILPVRLEPQATAAWKTVGWARGAASRKGLVAAVAVRSMGVV